MIQITPTGYSDEWSRPIYKSIDGRCFVDINCGDGVPDIHTVTDEGEPEMPLRNYQIITMKSATSMTDSQCTQAANGGWLH